MKTMSPPWNRCLRMGRSKNSRMGALQYQQAPKTTAYAKAALNSLDRSSSRCSRKLMDPLAVSGVSAIGRGECVFHGTGGLTHHGGGLLSGFLQGGADALDFLELFHLDFALQGRAELVRGLAELGDAAPEHPPDLRELAGSEQQERQHEDEKDFRPAERSEHRRASYFAPSAGVKERRSGPRPGPQFRCRGD